MQLYPYFNWLNMPYAADRKEFIATYCSNGGTDRLQNLFKSCMIRRTMGSQLFGRPIVWLPLSHRNVEDVQLSHQERVVYELLQGKYKTIIKQWDEKGELQRNRAVALVRHICTIGDLKEKLRCTRN